MTLSHFEEHISNLVGCVNFNYNGQTCGIDPNNFNEYDMWYGDKSTTVDSVDSVVNLKFFDGKSLNDIWDDISDIDY